MASFLNLEELGVYNRSGRQAIVLSTKGHEAMLPITEHFPNLLSIYDNSQDDSNDFIDAATKLGNRRICKQVIEYTEKYNQKGESCYNSKEGRRSLSTLEFDDKSRYSYILNPCALPFTIINGGDILIDDEAIASEKSFEHLNRKIDESLKKVFYDYPEPKPEEKNLEGAINVLLDVAPSLVDHFEASKLLEAGYLMFRDVKKNTKFKDIKSLKYTPEKKEPKINDSKYYNWKLRDIEIQSNIPSNIPPNVLIPCEMMLVGIFKQDEKNAKSEIVFEERNVPLFRGISKHVDKADLKSLIKELEEKKVIEGCNTFIHDFLEKCRVNVDCVYFDGKTAEHYVPNENGKTETRVLFKPQKSFVTLSNDSEKITVKAPIKWATTLGLNSSGIFKVKKYSIEKTRNVKREPWVV